jgi:hypothetical protein
MAPELLCHKDESGLSNKQNNEGDYCGRQCIQ